MLVNRITLLYLTIVCIIAISVIQHPVYAQDVDPMLVKALHQATRDINTQTTDLEKLQWLSSMSRKLENRVSDPFYRVRLLKTVYDEAEIAGLDPQLVLAVIETESGFNRYALSKAGAKGLMQVMPFWKTVLKQPDVDLFNPLVSIRLGCTILRRYMDKHRNTEDALAAYNGSLGRPTYSDKVLRRWNNFWQYKDDLYNSSSETKVALNNLSNMEQTN